MNRLLPLLLAAAFAAPLTAQTSVWKVTRHGQTLYLGGTCHVLRASDFPLPPEYDAAFAAAEQLLFETDLARVQSPEMQRIVQQHGLFTDGSTLEKVLSPEAWQSVQSWCAKNGAPVQRFAGMKPWFFTLMLTVIEMQKLGLTAQGVDVHYFKRAGEAGKQTGEMESFEEHVKFLLNLGAGHESEMVFRSIDELAELPKVMSDMLAAWRSGDLAKLDETMLKELREKYPSIHRELMVQRNQAWLPVIEKLLETPAVEFILVGVAHMAGPEGLVAALRERGCTVGQTVVKN